MQNFIGVAQANLASADAKEDAPWYVKYGARGFGTIAGGMAMLMGALNTITSILDPICIVLSIWQVVVGFGVITIESPCCCFFVEQVQTVSQKVESKPLYVKALVYVLAPLPSLFFCFGFATLFGSGLVIGCGVMYGFMALGKKASRAEMARNAQLATPNLPFQSTTSAPPTDKAILVENLRDPAPVSHFNSGLNSYQPNHSNNFGPPPAYTDLQDSKAPVDWNTPFTPVPPPPHSTVTFPSAEPYTPSSSVTAGSVNPVPSNPYNPFQ